MRPMVNRLSKLLSFLIVAASFSSSFAASVQIEVELFPAGDFTIKSSDIRGSIKEKGDIFYTKKLLIPVKALNSGISLRDKHMRKRLHAKKYPAIVVRNAKGKNGKGVGYIEINGVRKKIQFEFEKNSSGVEVEFDLSLKDFNIKDIDYKLVKVEDKVSIKAEVPLKGGGRSLAGR